MDLWKERSRLQRPTAIISNQPIQLDISELERHKDVGDEPRRLVISYFNLGIDRG